MTRPSMAFQLILGKPCSRHNKGSEEPCYLIGEHKALCGYRIKQHNHIPNKANGESK